MKLNIVIIMLLSLSTNSCNKNTNNRSPAQAISGSYISYSYQGIDSTIFYPINGQNISLEIREVSNDTVQVNVNSSYNGFYSPGNSSYYPRLHVLSTSLPGAYYITLAPPLDSGSGENTISFDLMNKAYYIYVPPNYKKGAVQSIFVKTN
jgi:hypothetical protein